VVFGAWELMGRYGPNMAIPPFSSTARGLFLLLVDGTLPKAYIETLKPLVVGLILAATVGIGFGITMGLSRTIEWFTVVIIVALQATPMAAVIPLVTFIYGLGFTAKMMAVFVLATPGIILNSYQGVRNVNVSLIQMSQAFLASRQQQIIKVIIPAASNMIVASLRMGLGAAFVGIILAELLITPTGLGDLITYYQCLGDYANMYATICSLIIISALSISSLKWVENSYSGGMERKKSKKQPLSNLAE
jgi:NitT/TauT family transport system permease protein